MVNDLENKMIDNNLKGKRLESIDEIDQAIKLYEYNIENRFQGNFPYDRLAIIYRKRKQYNDEIRVLKLAIDVFVNDVDNSRPDKYKKLEKFKTQLQKAQSRA